MTPSLGTLELILDTVAIQALVLSVLFFMRRRSAATQHLLLSLAVIGILALTLTSPLVPSRHLGLIPIEQTVAGPERAALSPAGDVPGPAQEDVADALPSTVPAETAVPQRAVIAWPRVLGTVWLVGTAALLLWMVFGLLYSWWLARRSRPTESLQLQDRFRWALERLGLQPGIALTESETVKIPVVFGFIRPTVILPTHASRWSEDRLRAVLLHESAHIRRQDLVFQFLAKLTCALYWFNPLSWIIERKLFLTGERAADDQVIRQEVSAADYAEHLMETSVELGTERNPIWATAAMAEGTAFKDRILSILDPNIRRGEPNMSNQAAVTLAAAAMVFSLLAFSPWRSASPAADRTAHQVTPIADTLPQTEGPGQQQQGGVEDLETLLRMLRMQNPDMREHAATALGQLGDRRAVLPLIDVVVSDPDARVREHAASALGVLGDARARDALSQVVVTDADARVREHAATALGSLKDAGARAFLTQVVREDPDPAVREHAIVALGQLGDRQSYEVLLTTLYGGDVLDVRAHAAFALGLLGDPRALEPLVAALQDESPIMRRNAAMGLGELGDQRAIAALRQAQRDADDLVRYHAREALSKIGAR